MWTTSVVVTSAIYAAALLDAVLIGVLLLQANGSPGKAGKLIGDRSKVCRAVCLGCVLTLMTAGGLLWRDFRGLNIFSREQEATPGVAAGLVFLLVFNLAINAMMIFFTLHKRMSCSANSRVQAATDLETGSLLHKSTGRKAGPVQLMVEKLVLSPPAENGKKRLVTAADMLFSRKSSTCSKVGNASKPTSAMQALLRAAVGSEILDRRDSEFLINATRAHTLYSSSKQAAAGAVTGCRSCVVEEDILDALMHDTVRTLVEV